MARRQQLGMKAIKDSMERAAWQAFRESMAGSKQTQFQENGIKVLVKNGYSRDRDIYTTDIVVIDPGRSGLHLHYIIDENGKEIHKKWTENH